jgi:hypothetical protein
MICGWSGILSSYVKDRKVAIMGKGTGKIAYLVYRVERAQGHPLLNSHGTFIASIFGNGIGKASMRSRA